MTSFNWYCNGEFPGQEVEAIGVSQVGTLIPANMHFVLRWSP
jgi:hypothetical protein